MTIQAIARTWKPMARGLSIATALAVVAACASDGGGPGAGGGGGPLTPTPIGWAVSQPAQIHDVGLNESAARSGTWILRVQYGLPGGCATPGGYALMESFPHQVRVNILMPADPSRACTMIYSYGNYDIELGGGYEPCESYDIRVNGEPHNVQAISPLEACPAEPSTSAGAP